LHFADVNILTFAKLYPIIGASFSYGWKEGRKEGRKGGKKEGRKESSICLL
jgi:hypothetical protein